MPTITEWSKKNGWSTRRSDHKRRGTNYAARWRTQNTTPTSNNASKSTEVLEEVVTETLSKSATVKDWIDDFIKSKDKKFVGDSRKQRIKRALGAFYSKKNEDYVQNVDRINEARLNPGDRVVATRNTNAGYGRGNPIGVIVKKGDIGTYQGMEQGTDKPYHHIKWDHLQHDSALGDTYHNRHEFKKV